MEDFEEFKEWCFSKHIFFYGYTSDSPAGFCKIVQWTHNGTDYQKKCGKVDFPIEKVEQQINELYKQVYFKNNQLTA